MKKSSLSHSVRVALALALVLAPLVASPDWRSSAAPSGPFVTFNQVADTSTAIPEGTGTFTNFPYAPAIDGGNVSVYATGAGGQQGVYRFVPPNPTRVADLSTMIPNGVGSFTNFTPTDPCISCSAVDISGSNVVFVGDGSDGQQGVYLANTLPNPPPITPLADTNTEIPGGAGNFTRFVPPNPTAPSISGQYAAFFGAGGEEQQGIYLVDVALPLPPPIMPVADSNTAIPGSAANFQFFSALASEANDVAFVGGGAEIDLTNIGVYKVLNVLLPIPPPIKVADLFTAVPDGIGNFTAFGSVAIDPGTVVFEGFSNDGTGGTRKGLYTDFGGTLSKLIATGDTLGGRVVSDLRFGPRGFNNHQVAFAPDFSDGTHAVFMATLTSCSIGFTGFHPPIGGADSTGGTYADPVRAFKLKSTVPVKMSLTDCDGQPLTTGVHTIQVIKFSNSTTPDPVIDATPTDAATTGNEFRLTDAATGEWHFNLSTKSLTKGIWQIKATLSDGSTHLAFIELK